MAQIPTWFRFILLATTIIGGLHGIAITLGPLFGPDVQGFGVSVLLGCMLVAYTFVMSAGVVFWLYPNQIRPLVWALTVQVPWISLPGLVYKFAAGLFGAVAFVANHKGDKYSAGFNTNWKLGSSFELRFLQNAPLEVGVNVAALAALFLVLRLTRPTTTPVEDPSSKNDDQSAVMTLTEP